MFESGNSKLLHERRFTLSAWMVSRQVVVMVVMVTNDSSPLYLCTDSDLLLTLWDLNWLDLTANRLKSGDVALSHATSNLDSASGITLRAPSMVCRVSDVQAWPCLLDMLVVCTSLKLGEYPGSKPVNRLFFVRGLQLSRVQDEPVKKVDWTFVVPFSSMVVATYECRTLVLAEVDCIRLDSP